MGSRQGIFLIVQLTCITCVVLPSDAVAQQSAAIPELPIGNSRRSGRPSVAEIFQRFDANQDDILEIKEIPSFARQFILPADKNRDQTITRQELTKYRANLELAVRQQVAPPRRRGSPRRRRGNGRAFGPFSGNTDPVRLNQNGLQIGDELPKLVVFDAIGNRFSTVSLRGSYSVLVFGCLT